MKPKHQTQNPEPGTMPRLTPFQRICARSWHRALGGYGTEQLYALHLSQNKKLIATQAENEILRQKLAEAGVPLD